MTTKKQFQDLPIGSRVKRKGHEIYGTIVARIPEAKGYQQTVILSEILKDISLCSNEGKDACLEYIWIPVIIKKQAWVNLYPDGKAWYYDSKKEAELGADKERLIATVFVEWEE